MSEVDAAHVARLAKVWHGIELEGAEAATLAGMLAPMDDAGEHLASRLRFEMEPSDFLTAMQAEANRSAKK